MDLNLISLVFIVFIVCFILYNEMINPKKSKLVAQVKPQGSFNDISRKNRTGSSNWEKFVASSEGSNGVTGHSSRKMKRNDSNIINLRKTPKVRSDFMECDDRKLTKVIGMDCEMVGIGQDGRESIVARVSIVNMHGDVLYDKFVKPREKVTDYRTHVSGVREDDLKRGHDFSTVQKEVSKMLQDRILVGHAIKHDLDVLFLKHPTRLVRDTSKYFRRRGTGTPSLKLLAEEYLGVSIQGGEHSSVQDARAAVQLYVMYRKEWESGGGNRNSNRIDSKKFVRETIF